MYFSKTKAGLSYKIRRRKLISSTSTDEDQILLDENEISKGHDQTVVAAVEPSPCHEVVIHLSLYLSNYLYIYLSIYVCI